MKCALLDLFYFLQLLFSKLYMIYMHHNNNLKSYKKKSADAIKRDELWRNHA